VDLTAYALEGYDEPDDIRPYMLGSDAYIAWRVGAWLRATGARPPGTVVSSAGYRVIVDDTRAFEVWEDTEVQEVTG
jgi:hypothetical protein